MDLKSEVENELSRKLRNQLAPQPQIRHKTKSVKSFLGQNGKLLSKEAFPKNVAVLHFYSDHSEKHDEPHVQENGKDKKWDA